MIYIQNGGRRPSILQILIGVFALFAFIYATFYLSKWIFYGLELIAPFLLIAAAALNFKTLKNFVVYLWNLIRRNVLLGIGLTLLSVVFFPVTCALLFFRAYNRFQTRRRMRHHSQPEQGEFIDYEIVEEENSPDWMKLPHQRL